MWKWMLVLVLLAAPLGAAERESNFGRVILDNCDLIVQGVASAKRTKLRAALRVEVTVGTVLYGKEKQTDVSVFYTDPKALGKKAVRALFALKRLADGGFNLVGKPVLTPQDDPEETDKLRVCRKFIKLEKMKAGDKRTIAFWNLLADDVLLGGYPAQNAAVELMFIAQKRRAIITVERFNMVVHSRDNAATRLTKETRSDLKLAFQGLVEARVKNLKFKKVRRGKDKKEIRTAARELNKLQKTYPRAFTDEDAKLCDALKEAGDDPLLNEKLKELARNIRADVRERQRDEQRKRNEARRKIEHAGK
jgi:hypothetical protein